MFLQADNETAMTEANILIPDRNISCPHKLVRLGKTEYHANGTIFTIKDGMTMIDKRDYSVDENGDILVCSDLLEGVKNQNDLGNNIDDDSSNGRGPLLQALSATGVIIAILFLLLTLITYSLFPILQNVPGKIVMNLCATLIIAETLLYCNRYFTAFEVVCKLVGFSMQYWWQVVFSWMNILGYDLSATFSNISTMSPKSDEKKKYKIYCAYAYGVPALYTLVCATMDLGLDTGLHYGHTGKSGFCWIRGAIYRFYTFGISIILVMNINLICFIRCVLGICSAMKIAKMAKQNTSKSDHMNIYLYLKLFSVMGFNWVFALLFGAFPDKIGLFYVHVICNSFQGFFIFTCFCANKRVWRMYKQLFYKRQETKQLKLDSSSSKSSDESPKSTIKTIMSNRLSTKQSSRETKTRI